MPAVERGFRRRRRILGRRGRTDGQKIESLDELVLYGWMERPDQAGVREESLL